MALDGYLGSFRYVGDREEEWITDQLEDRDSWHGYRTVDVPGFDASEADVVFDDIDSDLTLFTIAATDHSFYMDMSVRSVEGNTPSASVDRGFIRVLEAALVSS